MTLKCPECQSEKIRAAAREPGQLRWHCPNCGQQTANPRHALGKSPGMDVVMGVAVLLAMLTFAIALCLN